MIFSKKVPPKNKHFQGVSFLKKLKFFFPKKNFFFSGNPRHHCLSFRSTYFKGIFLGKIFLPGKKFFFPLRKPIFLRSIFFSIHILWAFSWEKFFYPEKIFFFPQETHIFKVYFFLNPYFMGIFLEKIFLPGKFFFFPSGNPYFYGLFFS